MAELLVFPQDLVLQAIDPAEAIERVRDGFVEYAGNEWQMPPKVYLDASPNGDFRAMPAKGAGLAILKWVTSFPGNPQAGLPVVMGVICVSSAVDGQPPAPVDGRAGPARSWTCARSRRFARARWRPWRRRSWRARTPERWASSGAGSTAPGRR